MHPRNITVVLITMLACTPRGGETPTPSRDDPSPPPPEVELEPKPELAPIVGLSQIAPGVHHTCALESGRVLCWGQNNRDLLGVGPDLPQYVTEPRPVIGLEDAGPIARVATDYDYSCALAQDGAVYCWGDNEDGELGVGDQHGRARPTRVADLSATSLHLGYEQACAIDRDHSRTYCWGRGFGTSPIVVAELAGVDQLANPGGHTCTLKAGAMLCWGANSGGQVGNGEGGCEWDEPLCNDCKRLPDRTCKHVETPTTPLGLPTIAEIAASSSYTYALDRDGGVWQWGQVGQTMSYGERPNYRPQRVAEIPPIVELSPGSAHVCALAEDGGLWCWGNDSFGQLGFENPDRFNGDHPSPYHVEGLPPARAVAAGFHFSCALTGEGEQTQAWCWGDNGSGQLGDGTTERRHSPTLVRVAHRN